MQKCLAKLKHAEDGKRELAQKMEWNEKFWKDKLTASDKERQVLNQREAERKEELAQLQAKLQQVQQE